MKPIGTPAVHSTIASDLYISIMNIAADQQSIGIVVIKTPMVSWIWSAVLLMGLGGVVALIPPRRAELRVAAGASPAEAAGAAASTLAES